MSSIHGPFCYAFVLCRAVLFSTLLTFGSPAMAVSKSTLEFDDIVKKVETSIVLVSESFSYQVNGDQTLYESTSSGTGFVIDAQGHIATANHVVDADKIKEDLEKSLERKNQTLVPDSFRFLRLGISIYAPNTEKDANENILNNISTGFNGKILVQDKPRDIAILSCASNLLKLQTTISIGGESVVKSRTVPVFQRKSPRNGEAIATTGFPAIGSTEKVFQIPGLTTVPGIVANSAFMMDGQVFVYLASVHVNEGNSGGPVYNTSDGSVIGFVDAFLNAIEGGNSGLTVVVPIGHVLDLLPQAAGHR
jgi:S1-C subfamily serine protease